MPSEEVRDTPDTDQLLKRKKPPAAFTLTTYAKVPTTPGVLPQWDALMANSYGSSGIALAVLAPPAGTETLSILLDNVPAPVTLPAGGDAAAIAAAIMAAVPDVLAVADGTTVVVTAKPGAGQLRITSSAPAVVKLGGVVYKLQTLPVDIVERLLTIVHGTDNAVDYYRDCLVGNVVVNALGTDEATLVFSGYLGNSTSMMQTHARGRRHRGA